MESGMPEESENPQPQPQPEPEQGQQGSSFEPGGEQNWEQTGNRPQARPSLRLLTMPAWTNEVAQAGHIGALAALI